MERHDGSGLSDLAEGVDIIAALPIPAEEADAQFESGIRRTDELTLIDAQRPVERSDLRNGRFAYAHSADLIGFDKDDGSRSDAGQGGCGHPAG